MATNRSGFFVELKRRHVWRVAIAYVVTAWVVLQLASVMLPSFGAPGWVMRVLFGILVILFPIALILAWAFEITPEGVRRTEPATSSEARTTGDTRAMGRKLKTGIIVALAIAVALLAGNQFIWHKGMGTAKVAAPTVATAAQAPAAAAKVAATAPGAAHAATAAVATAAPVPASTAVIPEKSVAVLPFTNDSGEKDQQFFSDGLSEDLINALSQFDGLKVISRNSAFQFRNSKDTSARIGELLGVARLLEGSVQRQGDEVRITATLVNAADGSTLWSTHYDKPYKDLFALQDAITAAVADALKAKLLTAPGAVVQSDRPPSGNLAAWNDFQQGKFYSERSSSESESRKAIGYFTAAIHADPHYAGAYAELALAWGTLAGNYLDPGEARQVWDKARAAVRTALSLDPDSAVAHSAHSFILAAVDFDWMGAIAEDKRAVQLAPNDPGPKRGLAGSLATLGHPAQAVALLRQTVATDPLCAGCYVATAHYLSSLGQFQQASWAIHKAIELRPGEVSTTLWLTAIDTQSGNATAALQAANALPLGHWRDMALAVALQIGPDHAAADAALQTLIAGQAGTSAYQIAVIFALRRDPDSMFEWLDRAWENRDAGIMYLLTSPAILRYRDDPRFAAFCKKVGLPTTTDAVAMK